MQEQFLNHIERFELCRRGDRILLAVSGGIDSMVMLHLFKHAGFTVGVAHCNFQLRGEESKGEEALVNMVCVEQGIPFYSRRFETEKYALENNLSIQMAARELRYQFFEELLNEQGYNFLATAHHLNDSLETVLLNLVRGTGLDGLTGIPVKNGKTIRPLLFATRQMIGDYATFYCLQWREDSSNTSEKYHRNLLRNQVIPLLKKINPNLEFGIGDTLQRILGASALAQSALEFFKREAVRLHADQLFIDKRKLILQAWPEVVLWELIKDRGFNYDQCKEIVLPEHQSGKVFYSDQYQLTIDRSDLIVSSKTTKLDFEVEIQEGQESVQWGKSKLNFQIIEKRNFVLDKNPSVAQLDLDTLHFPLLWRSWEPGDHFRPLGMTHSKKISDFLVDAKISLPEKETVTVLISNGKMVWLVGHRIDDRYKVTEGTNRILKIKEDDID